MDNKGFSDEAKNKIEGKSKSFSKYLTNAEFSFTLAKSPQCNASSVVAEYSEWEEG